MFTPDIVKKYDPTGMLTLIEQFPEQVQEAVAIGKRLIWATCQKRLRT